MSVYKTANEAYESLKANLENKLGDNIQTGSVIDIYNKVIADECEEMYALIENNKNPYLLLKMALLLRLLKRWIHFSCHQVNEICIQHRFLKNKSVALKNKILFLVLV